MAPPPPPELADDLLVEVFLRLSPDDLACLLRASLTCKRWRRILADPAFRRRHRELHGTPSVLGFFHAVSSEMPFLSRYIPVSSASCRPAGRDFPGWLALDCRHGRALFATSVGTRGVLDFLVWDPLTGERRHLPRPSPAPTMDLMFNAAVLCAGAENCDHSGCHGGAFRVVFVCSRESRRHNHMYLTCARVYSSETGDWSEGASVRHPFAEVECMPSPSACVGDTLYFCGSHTRAFEFHGTRRLSVIDGPRLRGGGSGNFISLVSMEDGGLCCTDVELRPSQRLCLWSKEAGTDGIAHWARGRGFELEKLLPNGALPAPGSPFPAWLTKSLVLGFAEGTDVIFVGTETHIFDTGAAYMIQLNSGKARKVFEGRSMVFPYTSFCIPVIDAACADKGAGEGVSSA